MLKVRLTLQKPELTIWDAEWAVPLQRVKVVSETQHKYTFCCFAHMCFKTRTKISIWNYSKYFIKKPNFSVNFKIRFFWLKVLLWVLSILEGEFLVSGWVFLKMMKTYTSLNLGVSFGTIRNKIGVMFLFSILNNISPWALNRRNS